MISDRGGGVSRRYLIMLPIMALVTTRVHENSRALFIGWWNNVLLACAQGVLLLLYNPLWRGNRSFPFHANTPQQLGIIAEVVRASEASPGAEVVLGGNFSGAGGALG